MLRTTLFHVKRGVHMALFRRKEKKEVVVDTDRIPQHIAIIMDGNGRWAKMRGMPRTAGHAAGAETFRTIATHCKNMGVKHLTVYAFSTENWKRPAEEVSAIMGLLDRYLHEAIEKMAEEGIRLRFWGDISALSPELQFLLQETNRISQSLEGMEVNICLNYGGRDEILRAARAFAADCVAGRAAPEELDEEMFSQRLWSKGTPDPDLVIRPSGEVRVSNFLLWQSAYAEYYFTDVLWPDFSPKELDKAIVAYQGRSRRFGGVVGETTSTK